MIDAAPIDVEVTPQLADVNSAVGKWSLLDRKADLSLDEAAGLLRRYCKGKSLSMKNVREMCMNAMINSETSGIIRTANAFLAPYEPGGVLYLKFKNPTELQEIRRHQQARRPLIKKLNSKWDRLRDRAFNEPESDTDEDDLHELTRQPPETCTDLVVWKPAIALFTLPVIVEQHVGRALRQRTAADTPQPKAASSTRRATKRRAAAEDDERAYRPPKKSKWEEAVPVQELKHKIEVIAYDISKELQSVNEDLAINAEATVNCSFVANLLKRILDGMNDISKGNAYNVAKMLETQSASQQNMQQVPATPTSPLSPRSPTSDMASPTTPECSPVSLHGHQLTKRRVVVVRSNTFIWGTISNFESPYYFVNFDDNTERKYEHMDIMPMLQPEADRGSHQIHLTDALDADIFGTLAEDVDHLKVGEADHPPSLERMDSEGDAIPPPPDDEHADKPTDATHRKIPFKRSPRPVVPAVQTMNGEGEQVNIRRKR